MALFGSNKPVETPLGPPTEAVLRMKQQGFSNSQIVQTLQREGYKSHAIFDALNQAETRPASAEESAIPPPPQEDNMQNQQINQTQVGQEQNNYGYNEPYNYPQEQSQPIESIGKEQIEEIAESIIEEKWQDFMKSVNKILEWKESIDTKFIKIEEQLKSLKEDYDRLHKGVIGKISEYDKNILDVGTEVKALGKTFEKIIPALAENVSELGRITSKVKKGSK